MQSGFMASPTISQALMKITNDFIGAADKGRLTVLVFFDFNKAFDIIPHDVLCAKFQYLGYDEIFCSVFLSYLTGGLQKVVLNNSVSEVCYTTNRVLQGLVCGLLLYNSYTPPSY